VTLCFEAKDSIEKSTVGFVAVLAIYKLKSVAPGGCMN
jgi:hypothetical protein